MGPDFSFKSHDLAIEKESLSKTTGGSINLRKFVSKTPVLISLHVCPRPVYPDVPSRYKILAPAAVDKAKEPKDAAAAILDSTGLDADSYRLGHTKARFTLFPLILTATFDLASADDDLTMRLWVQSTMLDEWNPHLNFRSFQNLFMVKLIIRW